MSATSPLTLPAAMPGPHIGRVKVTVVGDSDSGKTCMLFAFANNRFPGEHEVLELFRLDHFRTTIVIDTSRYCNVEIWDTPGRQDYERLRHLAYYPNTKVFLLCFAVNSQKSFKNVYLRWDQELKSCEDAKVVLVGTKTDTRPTRSSPRDKLSSTLLCRSSPPMDGIDDVDDITGERKYVTTSDGFKMMARIRASRYVECSAKTQQGIQEVFQEAVKCLLYEKANRDGHCCNSSSAKCDIV